MNTDILNQITNQNYANILHQIEEFLKKQLKDADGFVFGLSGGVDSAVVAHILARSFKSKTLALIMPDSKVSPKQETEDALYMVDSLGLDYKLVDINLIHSQFANVLEPHLRALGNLRARIRACLLYYYANLKKFLVVGTSDKSEYLIGYFTKFGDGSADILPIASLYKSQVKELARYLEVKSSIIEKKSSPFLWTEHLAESEIGLNYEEIDSILYCMFDKNMTPQQTSAVTQIEQAKIDKINQMHKNTEHKRSMPAKL